MRVEYLLPLPDAEDAPEQSFDTFLDVALKFAESRPVFTPQQLHQHLLEHFPLSRRPDDFWRCLGSIRNAMQQVATVRNQQPEWIVQDDGGYADKLLSLDIYEPSSADFTETECLKDYVVAELRALFSGRTEVTEHELLFYLRGLQGLGDEAEQVLLLLTEDKFLVESKYCVYSLGSATVPPPKLEPIRAAPQRTAEVPPPVPDLPFSVADRDKAYNVIRRLTWENARYNGVYVSTLVTFVNNGATPVTHLRSVIDRLWRRGYMTRDVTDPYDVTMRLPVDFPHDQDGYKQAMFRIMQELALPYNPQQKTGSE